MYKEGEEEESYEEEEPEEEMEEETLHEAEEEHPLHQNGKNLLNFFVFGLYQNFQP